MSQTNTLDFETAYVKRDEVHQELESRIQNSLLNDELRGFASASESLSRLGSYNPYADVKRFHTAFNHPVGDTPQEMGKDRREKRFAWMLEEIDEFKHADNLVDQIDALIDTLYLTYGTLVEMGVNPEPYFGHVHNANMGKLNAEGKPTYNAEGKVAKPDGWRGPEMDITRTLVTDSVHRFLDNPAFGTLDIQGLQVLKRRYDKMQSEYAQSLRSSLQKEDLEKQSNSYPTDCPSITLPPRLNL